MRLTTILLMVTFMQVNATGFAQKISINRSNAPLKTILKDLRKQSGYNFVYTDNLLKMAKSVQINVSGAEFEVVLKQIFSDQPLTYSIHKNSVTVKEKERFFSVDHFAETNKDIIVKGVITDSNGETLPGVSIKVKGSTLGGTTDLNGRYTINVPDKNSVLIFTYIGYISQELIVGERTTINVKLEVANTALNEVVVTALGIEREARSLAYATESVKPKEIIEIQDPNNFLNSFQGKISNALITQSLGGVGSDVSIILRGDRSIQGSSKALIVIDGVPSNFNTPMVNPNDIESVTVLKGASAGALYGSQAGNGAIIITTKKGNKNDVLVNLNSGVTVNSVYALPPMQNTYGQGSGGLLNASSGSSWGAKMEGQSYTDYKGNTSAYVPQPDNIKKFFDPGINLSNSLSISGGSEKIQGYLSYLNESKNGIVPTNNLLSHNVNLRLSTQINNRLSVDGNFTHLDQKIEDSRRGQKQRYAILALEMPRSVPFSYAQDYETIDGNGLPTPNLWPSPDKATYQNPFWVLNRNKQSENLNQTAGYLKAKYNITDWLNVTGNANLSKTIEQSDTKVWNGTTYNPQKPGGTFIRENVRNEQQWFDVIFDGKNSITKDFKVNYQFGAIYKDNTYDVDVFTASGLNVPNTFSLNYATTPIMNSASTQIQTQSLFGQLNFSYKDAIFLDGSLRNDWSSLLPAPHSFKYFSVGTSAILSSLFTLPEDINYLKASINYAEVGNGGQFGLLASTYNYRAGAASGYLLRSSVLPFPGLKPEIVKNIELGAEISLWDNRLNAGFTYYQSNSFNQLISISVPPATGYGSKYINAGNIRNRGIELTLGANPVRTTDFNWDVALNFSLNRNKIIEIDEKLKTIYLNFFSSNTVTTQISEGGSYGDIYSNYWLRNANGEFLVNSKGLPATSDQAGKLGQIIGNFNPREMVGMTNTFNYKKFSLRLLVDGRIGGEVISGMDMDLAFDGGPAFTAEHREGGWNLNGVDENGVKQASTISAQDFWQRVSSKRYGVGEFFAYDATNFRVREVALGFGIPVTGKKFIKSARVSLIAKNLFFLYRGSSKLDIPGLGKRKMWFDPDMTGGGVQDQFSYIPSTRAIGLNFNVNF